MIYTNVEKFIIRPKANRYTTLEFIEALNDGPNLKSVFGENTRPVYFLLVTNLNTSLETKDFWSSGKSQLDFNEHNYKDILSVYRKPQTGRQNYR